MQKIDRHQINVKMALTQFCYVLMLLWMVGC